MEVDLEFVSWELQIDHCLCGTVRKRRAVPRTVLDAHDVPRETQRLCRQVTGAGLEPGRPVCQSWPYSMGPNLSLSLYPNFYFLSDSKQFMFAPTAVVFHWWAKNVTGPTCISTRGKS